MNQVNGIWLPDEEKHYAEHPNLGDKYPVLEFALGLLNKRRIAFDIGAHVGLWSRWLVREFEFVHSFEPIAEYCEIFRENVTEKNYFLHECALGESFRRVKLKKFPDDTGRAHIDGYGHIAMWPLDTFQIYEVDLIKIDVEGYELQVVKGGRDLLLKNKPIVIIEQRGCEIVNFGEPERDVAVRWLEDIGMRKIKKIGSDFVMGW